MVSVRQIKAARALLAWSQEDLAKASGVSYPTVARLESNDGELGGRSATADKIIAAIEAAGIEFTNSGMSGLRFSEEYNRLRHLNAVLRAKIEEISLNASPLVRAKIDAIAADADYSDLETLEMLKAAHQNLCRRRDALIELGCAVPYDFN